MSGVRWRIWSLFGVERRIPLLPCILDSAERVFDVIADCPGDHGGIPFFQSADNAFVLDHTGVETRRGQIQHLPGTAHPT